MDIADAIAALDHFSGGDLTSTLSRIESSLTGRNLDESATLLIQHSANHDALAAAGIMKRISAQIDVLVHALGILLCLPGILGPDEVIESVSLGAGNTGRLFDLETNRRVAEFKFITWHGGSETIRQNSVFKDFYYLAEHDSGKSKHLYVLDTKHPLAFLRGGRALTSVLSKNVHLQAEMSAKYPEYRVVRDYYLPRQSVVSVEDISEMVPELTAGLKE